MPSSTSFYSQTIPYKIPPYLLIYRIKNYVSALAIDFLAKYTMFMMAVVRVAKQLLVLLKQPPQTQQEEQRLVQMQRPLVLVVRQW